MTIEETLNSTAILRIDLPKGLVDRLASYASENNSTVVGIIIEALDIFFREQSHPKN